MFLWLYFGSRLAEEAVAAKEPKRVSFRSLSTLYSLAKDSTALLTSSVATACEDIQKGAPDRSTAKTFILKSLSRKDTSKILLILFDRLYTLRNQILHGAATWNSNVNRSQINDGSNILSSLVPQFIFIMMKNHNKNWGSLAYPIHKD